MKRLDSSQNHHELLPGNARPGALVHEARLQQMENNVNARNFIILSTPVALEKKVCFFCPPPSCGCLLFSSVLRIPWSFFYLTFYAHLSHVHLRLERNPSDRLFDGHVDDGVVAAFQSHVRLHESVRVPVVRQFKRHRVPQLAAVR